LQSRRANHNSRPDKLWTTLKWIRRLEKPGNELEANIPSRQLASVTSTCEVYEVVRVTSPKMRLLRAFVRAAGFAAIWINRMRKHERTRRSRFAADAVAYVGRDASLVPGSKRTIHRGGLGLEVPRGTVRRLAFTTGVEFLIVVLARKRRDFAAATVIA